MNKDQKSAEISRVRERFEQSPADGSAVVEAIRPLVGMEWNPKDENLYAVGNGIDNFHTIFPDIFTDWQAAMLPSEAVAVKDGKVLAVGARAAVEKAHKGRATRVVDLGKALTQGESGGHESLPP